MKWKKTEIVLLVLFLFVIGIFFDEVISETNDDFLSLEYIHEWDEDPGSYYWVNDLCTVDVDNDGIIEMLIVGGRQNALAQGQLIICTWDGSVFKTEKNELFMIDNNETIIESIKVGDINEDGICDIVLKGYSWVHLGGHRIESFDWIRIFTWDGFKLHSIDTMVIDEGWIEIVDLNDDGADEIANGYTIYSEDKFQFYLQVWCWDDGFYLIENMTNIYHSDHIPDDGSTNYQFGAVSIGQFHEELVIVTGGSFWGEGEKYWGELCMWSVGSNLTLKDRVEWETEGTPIEWAQYWTLVEDVKIEDNEIYSVGWINNGTFFKGQLRVWNTEPLALKESSEWLTYNDTFALSLFVKDVDNYGLNEIVTGGYSILLEDSRGNWNAQLVIWKQNSLLTIRDSEAWYTDDLTQINAVYVEDIDVDGFKEIITAGTANNFDLGQLTIWSYQEEPQPTPPSTDTGGIPGFPLEGIILGLAVTSALLFIMRKRTQHMTS